MKMKNEEMKIVLSSLEGYIHDALGSNPLRGSLATMRFSFGLVRASIAYEPYEPNSWYLPLVQLEGHRTLPYTTRHYGYSYILFDVNNLLAYTGTNPWGQASSISPLDFTIIAVFFLSLGLISCLRPETPLCPDS